MKTREEVSLSWFSLSWLPTNRYYSQTEREMEAEVERVRGEAQARVEHVEAGHKQSSESHRQHMLDVSICLFPLCSCRLTTSSYNQLEQEAEARRQSYEPKIAMIQALQAELATRSITSNGELSSPLHPKCPRSSSCYDPVFIYLSICMHKHGNSQDLNALRPVKIYDRAYLLDPHSRRIPVPAPSSTYIIIHTSHSMIIYLKQMYATYIRPCIRSIPDSTIVHAYHF